MSNPSADPNGALTSYVTANFVAPTALGDVPLEPR